MAVTPGGEVVTGLSHPYRAVDARRRRGESVRSGNPAGLVFAPEGAELREEMPGLPEELWGWLRGELDAE